MNWLLGAALTLAVLGIGFLLVESRHQRLTYESLYGLLVRDRDAAREEVVTLRKALFPQLERMMQSPKPQPKPPTTHTATREENFAPVQSRKPFRQQFRDLVRAHNTRQIGTDRLAQAIEETQPQPAAKE